MGCVSAIDDEASERRHRNVARFRSDRLERITYRLTVTSDAGRRLSQPVRSSVGLIVVRLRIANAEVAQEGPIDRDLKGSLDRLGV